MGKFREVNEAAQGVRHRVISESGPSVDLDGRVVSDPRGLGRVMQGMQMLRELAEAGYIDGAQFRDMSQRLRQGGGPGIERGDFWQGLLGSGFDAFGNLRMPGSNLGPSELGAGRRNRGYDWRDEGGEAPGVDLGRWGLVAQGGTELGPDPEASRLEKFLLALDAAAAAVNEVSVPVFQLAAPQSPPPPFPELPGGAGLPITGRPDIDMTIAAYAGLQSAITYAWLAYRAGVLFDIGPDEVYGPTRHLAAALLRRVNSPGVSWHPPRSGGGARVRPPAPDLVDGSRGPARSVTIGGLADEPLRRRGPEPRGPIDEDEFRRRHGVGDPGPRPPEPPGGPRA